MTEKRTQLAVVLFCDVVGSTVLRVGLGDDTADQLNALVTVAIRNVIDDHGGKVIKGLGDGFMAIFDSTVGAVAAGVEMHIASALTAIQSKLLLPGTEVALRVGISAGEVAQDDSDYFGTPVVEAARLVSAAKSHEVLVSDLVRALVGSRGHHQFDLAGEYTLKGLPLPVTCYSVPWDMPAPVSSAPLEFPEGLADQRQGPFVGREALLADIRENIDTQKLHALLLYGEPGIGKTRLVAEVAWTSHQNGTAITTGQCEVDNTHAYGLWIELFRPVLAPESDQRSTRTYAEAFSQLAQHNKHALNRLLPGLLPATDASQGNLDPESVATAITELLTQLSAAHDSMIIIDDLQWADADSLAVLRLLLKHPIRGLTTIVMYCDRDITVMRNIMAGQVTTKVLAATISELALIHGVRREALRPLDAADVASFVAASFSGTLTNDADKLAAQIFEETEGNPMFVAEILQDLVSRNPDDLAHQMNNEGIGLPQRLRETIHRRIARLGEETLRVLSFAAVIGRKFDIDTLESITETDVLDDLDLAEEAGIVSCKDSGRYEFSHIIIHEALLAELSATRRARVTDHIAKLAAAK
jgi:class 3 adenylate cyclase/DNA polymerase III delta prime subunit